MASKPAEKNTQACCEPATCQGTRSIAGNHPRLAWHKRVSPGSLSLSLSHSALDPWEGIDNWSLDNSLQDWKSKFA